MPSWETSSSERMPVSGLIMRQSGNVVDSLENASKYVTAPGFGMDQMDFHPLAGKCQGTPLDLSLFETDSDFTRDLDGVSKVRARDAVVFRGAYASEGAHPGWHPGDGLKPPFPPSPRKTPALVWVQPASGRPGTTVKLELTGADFQPGDHVEISGSGISLGTPKVTTATHIDVTAKLAAGLPPSEREITVTGASGKSNPLRFRVAGVR